MNLHTLKTQLEDRLATVIHDSTQRRAERQWLLEYALGLTPIDCLAHPSREFTDVARIKSLWLLVDRRINERIPLQQLLGEVWFFGRRLKVSAAVLIPRPETELLVEKALALCEAYNYRAILDIGTGSGCIAITLKGQCQPSEVTAIDISTEALAIARENAAAHHTEIRFLQGSFLEAVAGEYFDLIVSNPPYISLEERDTLSPEVLQEPSLALFAPDGPEALYKILLAGAQRQLNPGGAFVFELGQGQDVWALPMARALGFEASMLNDLAGIPRILWGLKL